MLKNLYLLRKAKKQLRGIEDLYLRKKKNLDDGAKKEIEAILSLFRDSIHRKNKEAIQAHLEQAKEISSRWMTRSPIERFFRFFGSLSVALLVAIVIRQMWFELYTIPTGSMRPTLKESDVLIVSKTDFGLNIPLQTAHFYFDPALVKRGSVVVFTGANMDIEDADTVYFGLFPGKKQFVKRLIGKPGDLLYFYGGKIYGIDAQGQVIRDLDFPSLEHIPFIHLDGKVVPSHGQGNQQFGKTSLYQMNQKVAELEAGMFGTVRGTMQIPGVEHYSDLWGMGNYAMARLLTREQLEEIHPKEGSFLPKADLYLELTHHPSLEEARMARDASNRMRPDLGYSVSFLPLNSEHIERIAAQMTTCRFVVEKGVAHRLGFEAQDPFYSRYFPKLDVPDGTYEIQNGTVYRVYTGGFTRALDQSHPLYNKSPKHVQMLYNLGIELFSHYQPAKGIHLQPSRYAYFRDGDLYLLGAPIIFQNEPVLNDFLYREEQREAIATKRHPYFAFKDRKAPFKENGELDLAFLQQYGLKIPDQMYLMLGDNHAMSADSRQFGFVPQDNLKGGVSFLLSPFGSRFGSLKQPAHAYFGFPNVFVWGIALAAVGVYSYRKKKRKLG